MKIRFRDEKIRSLCENEKLAIKKLGADNAKKLAVRLVALEAADNVSHLSAGNPHPLKGDRTGQFALNLAGGYRLVFAPGNEPTPTKPDKSVDWAQVTIVTIEFIGDYHD